MNDETVERLLDQWESGELSAEEICTSFPEVAADVQAMVKILDKMNSLLEPCGHNGSPGGTETTSVPPSIEQFRGRLLESGLMSFDEIEELVVRSQPATVRELILTMRESGRLTDYQIETLCKGDLRLVLNDYVLLQRIGLGGMGEVFKAIHRRTKRVVALKLLPPGSLNSTEAVQRFRREVEAAMKLDHRNIVAAHDAGEVKGNYYLVLQYFDTPDLQQSVQRHGPMPADLALQCAIQALQGLDYAHNCGIIHRDIKPANLILDNAGILKILDMGVVRIEGSSESLTETIVDLTVKGAILGTLDFMSPEQAIDTQSADAKSDIYSLGCTVFYLLTGEVPYPASSTFTKLTAHREQPIPEASLLRPDVPNQISSVLKRMMAKEPDERFGSAMDALSALRSVENEFPVTNTIEQWRKWKDQLSISEREAIAEEDIQQSHQSTGISQSIDTLTRKEGLETNVWKSPDSERVSANKQLPNAPACSGYRILGVLGRGAMGTVWRAQQLSTSRNVALKVTAIETESDRVRFEREVQLGASLEHKNIARIYASGLDNGQYFYAMELVEGSRLDEYCRSRNASPAEIADLMKTACMAVDYAHRRGVIHRDLKPSNIMIRRDESLCVLDFGLAAEITKTTVRSEVSLEGCPVGTPAYMSPEQAGGFRSDIDLRSDVYNLGVVLYKLLTGHVPFHGSLEAIIDQVMHDDPHRPSKLNPHTPKELEAICLKAMAKEPRNRYQTAGEMAADLQRYLDGNEVTASGTRFLGRLWTWCHHPSRIREAAIGTILIYGGFTLLHLLVMITGLLFGHAERYRLILLMLAYLVVLDAPFLFLGAQMLKRRRTATTVALLAEIPLVSISAAIVVNPSLYPFAVHSSDEAIRGIYTCLTTVGFGLVILHSLAFFAYRHNQQLLEWQAQKAERNE